MSDEPPNKRTRRPRPVTPDGTPPASPPGGGVDDPDHAPAAPRVHGHPGQDRWAVGGPQAAAAHAGRRLVRHSGPAAFPASHGLVEEVVQGPTAAPGRVALDAHGRSHRRPGGVPRGGQIALVGIVVNSGVMGGSDTPTTTPTTTSTKAGSVSKKYVVKTGDSLSSIAVRFIFSTAEPIQLNPDLDGSTTLVVGMRIVVPRK